MEKLIRLEAVKKSYCRKPVLDNIDLSLYEGQTVAIIGPNGSGKSTLLRIIADLTGITAGKRIALREKLYIAYVPEHFPKLKLTPEEYLMYMGSIQGLSKSYIKERMQILFSLFNIMSMKDTLIKYLSKGTIQKVAVIQAILSEADILLLDEPLSGQDAASQKNFIQLMKEYGKNGTAIVLACHEEPLVEKLADKVIELDGGRIAAVMENESARIDTMSIDIDTSDKFELDKIKDKYRIIKIAQSDSLMNIIVDRKQSDELLAELLQMKCSIISVQKFRIMD